MASQMLTITKIPVQAPTDPQNVAAYVRVAAEALVSARTSWTLASDAVARQISPAASRILAEPKEGPGGAVAWHTPLPGAAREFAALSGPERDRAAAAVRAASVRLAELGKRLSSSRDAGGPDAAAAVSAVAAALLAKVNGRAGPESIFLVAGVPVLVGWFLPGAVLPGSVQPPNWSPAAEVAPLSPGGAFLPFSPSAGGASPDTGDAGGGGALRAALTAAAAFAIVLFLFLAISPDLRKAAVAAASADPMAGVDSAREGALRSELGSLKERYGETLSACREAEPEPPPEDVAPDLPDPEREENRPLASAEAPIALEAAANAPKKGEQLSFPEGTTDLSVLEGCWKVDSVKSEHSGNQIYFVHCFDKTGRARMSGHLYEFRRWHVCRGSSRASFPSGGRLTIATTKAPCPEGGWLVARTLRCAARSTGAAACTLTDHGAGGKTHPTRITRQ
jgi:hypothetical protein